jgi:hypothetical protein
MWDPQHLTTLQASTACYEDSFIDFTLIRPFNAQAIMMQTTLVKFLTVLKNKRNLPSARVQFQV